MKKLAMVLAAASISCISQGGGRNLEVSVTEDTDGFTVVSYVLTGEAAVVTFDVFTNGVSVGASGVSRARGDVWKLIQPGETAHTIKWRADRDLPEQVFAAGQFDVRVTAWPVNDPPDYMVVDLVTNATVRTPQVSYYPTADHLPAGGLANRNYARNRLVMRKIPAANRRWMMGDATTLSTLHEVVLTENYYIGIYELTSAQRAIMNGGADPFTTASERADARGYNGYRGAAWPTDGHDGAAGEIAVWRAFTGIDFDLPTEAQWEFAARGGEHNWNSINGTNVVVESDNLAPMLDDVAWYGYNTQNSSGKCAIQPVGLLKPNGYGLYDVQGNVFEWCLDFWRNPLPGPAVTEIDPPGGTSGNRVQRGGCFNRGAETCTLDYRRAIAPTWYDDGLAGVDGVKTATHGARLVCPAVAVK